MLIHVSRVRIFGTNEEGNKNSSEKADLVIATRAWFPLGFVVTFRGWCGLWIVVVRYRAMMHLGTLESILSLLTLRTHSKDFRVHRIIDNAS